MTKTEEEEKKARGRSAKAGLVMPVSRVNRHLKERSDRVSGTAPVYTAAVLEYIVGEIVQAAGAKAAESKPPRRRINAEDVARGLRSDPELHRATSSISFFTGDKMKDITKAITLEKTEEAPDAPDAA